MIGSHGSKGPGFQLEVAESMLASHGKGVAESMLTGCRSRSADAFKFMTTQAGRRSQASSLAV